MHFTRFMEDGKISYLNGFNLTTTEKDNCDVIRYVIPTAGDRDIKKGGIQGGHRPHPAFIQVWRLTSFTIPPSDFFIAE